MDFLEAVNHLQKLNPDCDYSSLRSAMQSETDSEESNLSGRGKYERAVTTAYKRISEWLKTGDEYGVQRQWRDLASFAASHRPACVYAVLIAKARADEAQDGYERVAEDLAKRGKTGEIGEELPANLPASVVALINADPEAFQRRVREHAYGIAMEKSSEVSR
jgi:hypothetical protein